MHGKNNENRAVATMYELKFRGTSSPFTVSRIAETVDLATRLADREKLPPAELDLALAARSNAHAHSSEGEKGAAGDDRRREHRFVPQYPLDRLFPGTYYLASVGLDRTRRYIRRPKDAVRARGGALAPAALSSNGSPLSDGSSSNGSLANGAEKKEQQKNSNGMLQTMAAKVAAAVGKRGVCDEGEEVSSGGGGGTSSSTVATMTATDASISSGRDDDEDVEGEQGTSPSNGSSGALKKATSAAATLADRTTNNNTAGDATTSASVAARLEALLPRVVVTGVACGLPGQANVFEEDNLARLLAGQGCVEPLSATSMAALVEKNVIQVKRQPGGQPPLRIPINKPSQTIKLAARLGDLDMGIYGVSPSIAATMDKAVKVPCPYVLDLLAVAPRLLPMGTFVCQKKL